MTCTDEELLDALRAFADEHGRPLTAPETDAPDSDLPTSMTFANHFGSWNTAVAEEERRRLIKRVEAGVACAQQQGKWTGRVPTGFRHDDDGYLQVLLDPDRENGEVGYLEVRRALERVTDGESYRAVARDMPNLTRQGLMKIDNDSARRQWYLGAEATNERVDAALETVR